MTKINLRDFYPFCCDCVVDVPDEVAAELYDAERRERSYARRVYRNKAQYSLDTGDGLECEALFISVSPYEVYERKITVEQLSAALDALPDKQGRRIYAHYMLGVSKADIARAEGVCESAIRDSVDRGLKNMERFLEFF